MIKFGIIGCGDIAEWHVKGFQETGRAQLAGVTSRSAESAAKAAAKWNVKAYSTVDELLKVVDAVAICTPGFARLEYIQKAAAAGKHIMCEKPLALNIDEALAIKKAVDTHQVTFMVAFNLRHDPRFRLLRQRQLAGDIGGTVSAWYRIWAPSPSSRWIQIQQTNHWRASAELSGGRINEFGGHGVNWLLWVLGKPKTVYGKAMVVTEGFTVDDADHAIIECEGGVGILEINRHAAVPADLGAGIIGHGGSVVLKDGKLLQTIVDKQTTEMAVPTVVSKHAEFIDCIEKGKRPENDVDAGIETLRVCQAFNRSIQSGIVERV